MQHYFVNLIVNYNTVGAIHCEGFITDSQYVGGAGIHHLY